MKHDDADWKEKCTVCGKTRRACRNSLRLIPPGNKGRY